MSIYGIETSARTRATSTLGGTAGERGCDKAEHCKMPSARMPRRHPGKHVQMTKQSEGFLIYCEIRAGDRNSGLWRTYFKYKLGPTNLVRSSRLVCLSRVSGLRELWVGHGQKPNFLTISKPHRITPSRIEDKKIRVLNPTTRV